MLAKRWNSVSAHTKLAALRLKRVGLFVSSECDGPPIPSVKLLSSDATRKPAHVLMRLGVRGIWKSGVDLALAASESNFEGWTLAELHAGFSCVTHFTAISESLDLCNFDSDAACALKRWSIPLLKLIYQRIYELDTQDKSTLKSLQRQTHAIRAMLSVKLGPAQDSIADDCPTESEESETTVVVIKGVIPKASDKSDNDILTQYEALRKPMALAAMPCREKIGAIQVALEQEFPWATAAIETIMSEIRARKRFGSNVLGMQPVLLCGPPGTGKTRLTQRLSVLLAIPNTVINLAGMTDTKTLKGVTRGWASNRPSRIVESILHSGPTHMFLLDEVDKAHGYGTNSGDPQEALLDLLEPQNARRYSDVFLQTECDVSHCLYVLTANSLSRITKPLLSRLSLAYLPPPGPEHAVVIAKGLLRDIEESWRIPSGALEITQMEMQQLIGLSPREMRRAVMVILGEQHSDQRYTLH